jgi:MtaA/CmuA family methyltransferase
MLKGEQVDFLPRIPIVMQYAAEYIGSNYGAFASDYRVLVEANCRCARDFGFEQLSAISDPYRETSAFGGQITYVRDGVPRCIPPLENSNDISILLRPDPRTSHRMADRVRAISEYKRLFGNEYSILGWIEGPAAEAADLRGVTNFLMDTLEGRDFLAGLLDLCVEVGIEFAKAQIAAGADTIGIGDAIASQLSPDSYESLIQPREKLLVEAIHDAGTFVRLHICGNITHLLPGIADLGVDILDVDHMVEVMHVREVVGKEVAISCNIDPVKGIMQGTTASIRQYVKGMYRSVGNPFMVSAGCEIPSGTPPENLKALCEPIPYLKNQSAFPLCEILA